MSTEKNCTIRISNGTDFDTYYPKTKAAQIVDKGAANGVASLGSTGVVPAAQRYDAVGTSAGTSSALTLDYAGFALTDGAEIRFKLGTDMNKGATLNVNSTGAVKIVGADGKGVKAVAGAYITLVYSATNSNFILQGSSGGGTTLRYGNAPGQISTYELVMVGGFNPFYSK